MERGEIKLIYRERERTWQVPPEQVVEVTTKAAEMSKKKSISRKGYLLTTCSTKHADIASSSSRELLPCYCTYRERERERLELN